jgi:flavin-dependent dehydrogenase
MLVDAAAEAGAEQRERSAVKELVWVAGRVVGVRVQDLDSGRSSVERARLVVGADGPHSSVARLADAPVYDQRPGLTALAYGYWHDLDCPGVELYPREGRFIVAQPTNDHAV